MARASLFYTVTSARTHFCRGFAFAIQTSGRAGFDRELGGRPLVAARGAATIAPLAGRKESTLHNFVVATDGVEQSRSQQHGNQQLQQPCGESQGDKGNNHRSGDAKGAHAAREAHLETTRTLRPDNKRMLRIPEEEWPR